jgi:hypothetical protein
MDHAKRYLGMEEDANTVRNVYCRFLIVVLKITNVCQIIIYKFTVQTIGAFHRENSMDKEKHIARKCPIDIFRKIDFLTKLICK